MMQTKPLKDSKEELKFEEPHGHKFNFLEHIETLIEPDAAATTKSNPPLRLPLASSHLIEKASEVVDSCVVKSKPVAGALKGVVVNLLDQLKNE